MQLQVLGASRREKLQKRLSALSALLAEAKSGITFRELRRFHSFSEGEIRQLHQVFPTAFTIERSKGGTGRPSEILTIRQAEAVHIGGRNDHSLADLLRYDLKQFFAAF